MLPLIFLGFALLGLVIYGIMTRRPQPTAPKRVLAVATNKGAPPKVEKVVEENLPNGDLYIYFGSQTGTAEGYARTLAKEGKTQGFNVKVVDMDDFNEDKFATHKLVILTIATYGEGEPTDNAKQMYKFLTQKDVDESKFAQVKFTVFGLGNRQYEHYNMMAKRFDECLEKWGATRMFNKGEGDDDGTLEDDFSKWKEELWPTVLSYVSNAVFRKGSEIPVVEYPLAVEFVNKSEITVEAAVAEGQVGDDINAKTYFSAVEVDIDVLREVRQSTATGSTRHLELNISGTSFAYQTADDLLIHPDNPADIVAKTAQRLGYELEAVFKWRKKDGSPAKTIPFPVPCSIRTALTRYCDLLAAPKKALVREIATFAKDSDEQKRLLRLTSKESEAEFQEYINESGRDLLDVLNDYPSVEIPLEIFIQMAPRLKGRYYTISSSSLVHPSSIHVTFSIANHKRFDGCVRNGACSDHICRVAPHSCLRVGLRESTFRLPPQDSTPVIMVGPGTGIAPFRAFLQQRRYLKEHGSTLGRAILYFGCRRKDEDYIYRDELESYLNDATLTELHVAFSRQQSEKVYVQHQLEENWQSTWDVLDKQGGYFYVCGGTSMGRDVHAVLEGVVMKAKGVPQGEAHSYIKKLQDTGRYVQELWG
eukprot:GILJ01004378.1.p1 GENE.GILJ01004378.1~~GILJ01004378.1.p1  ORF type:complete len:648 (+),score=114.84 GILJ01004378.1:54-1997(+)